MSRWWLLSLVAALAPISAADFATLSDSDLIKSYAALRAAALDPNRVAAVESLVLRKFSAEFQFKSGTFYFLGDVGGRVTGAVFLGTGVFKLSPAGKAERMHLARELNGPEELDEPFEQVVLFFSDGTFEELARDLRFSERPVPARATEALTKSRELFRDQLRTNAEARVLDGLCDPSAAVFLARIDGRKHGELLLTYDPREQEEVELLHRQSAGQYFASWASFRPDGASPVEHREYFRVPRISIETTIEKEKELSGTTVMQFQPLTSGARLLRLRLAPTLRVSKVFLGQQPERELKFIQEDAKRDADLWVALTEPLRENVDYVLRIVYAGGDVVQSAGEGTFFVGSRTDWYPRLDGPGHAFADRSVYRLVFHTPREYTLVATGRLVNHREEGKTEVTEWETDIPYPVVGFNYGAYRPVTGADSGIEIGVYTNPGLVGELSSLKRDLEEAGPQGSSRAGMAGGAFNSAGMARRTLAEAMASLRLFTFYYGPLPFKNLSITQQPEGYRGQSWPTLVFMPYTAFLDSTTRDQLGLLKRPGMRQFLDEVGSHEIAHQWWGHTVGWKSYHDQWMSEGFAQFSAGLYTHRVEGEKRFLEFMEHERDAILKSSVEGGPAPNGAGPIWMGWRLTSDKYKSGYRLLYSKGGYVLHMLRMMMYVYLTRDESRFIAMMKDFTSAYANRNASTEDFKGIVSKHFNTDMGWFFDQWVYGVEVPHVLIEYSVEPNEKGAMVKGTIRQTGVSPDFRILMPMAVRFRGNRSSIARLVAKGPVSPFQIQVPERPEAVEFNMLDAVLCNLEVKRL